jgi:hypothetical protein
MKISELTGAELDYWVAKAEGVEPHWQHEGKPQAWVGVYFLRGEPIRSEHPASEMEAYCPSSNWAHGGPIIEREGIAIFRDIYGWKASTDFDLRDLGEGMMTGPTPLIAAMRAYVASKFGEDVQCG